MAVQPRARARVKPPPVKISCFTPSYEALGRLLKMKKKKKKKKIRISHMSDFSCGETKVRSNG